MPRFEAGNPGGPGRPPGSVGGRRRALQVIDEILAVEENADALRAALQARFDADPVEFWLRIGAPLVPREARLELLGKPPDPMQEMYLAAIEAVAEADRERAEERDRKREQEGRPPLRR